MGGLFVICGVIELLGKIRSALNGLDSQERHALLDALGNPTIHFGFARRVFLS